MEPRVEAIPRNGKPHGRGDARGNARGRQPFRRPQKTDIDGYVESFRWRLDKLEARVRDKKDPGSRMEALNEMLRLARTAQARLAMVEEEHRRSPDGRLAAIMKGMHGCYDACCFALERLTASDDSEVRQKAFDFIKWNSISVKMAYLFSPHGDIKDMARELFPTRPNRYYEAIGLPEHTNEYDELARRILAALLHRKGGSGEEARRALDAVRREINAHRKQGRKDVTDKELASAARRYLSGKECASAKELTDAFRRVRKAERAQRPEAAERQPAE